jgi:hypothetical protein
MTRCDVPIGEKIVLVLETRNDRTIGYYFVDYANQSVFWLDPFRFLEMDELKVEFSNSHVGEFPTIVASFLPPNEHFRPPDTIPILVSAFSRIGHPRLNDSRYHNNLFPDLFPICPDAVSQLKDMLIYAVGGQSVYYKYPPTCIKYLMQIFSLHLIPQYRTHSTSCRRCSI